MVDHFIVGIWGRRNWRIGSFDLDRSSSGSIIIIIVIIVAAAVVVIGWRNDEFDAGVLEDFAEFDVAVVLKDVAIKD